MQGATNTVPTLCGDATGQHSQFLSIQILIVLEPILIHLIIEVYLDVSDYTNNVNLQLSFNFGTTATTRSWNIKMSMLPCGASYLGMI